MFSNSDKPYNINYSIFYSHINQCPMPQVFEHTIDTTGASVSIDFQLSDKIKTGVVMSLGSSAQIYPTVFDGKIARDGISKAIASYITLGKEEVVFYGMMNTAITDIITVKNILNKYVTTNGTYRSNEVEGLLGYNLNITKNISVSPLLGVRLANIVMASQYIGDSERIEGINNFKFDSLIGAKINHYVNKAHYLIDLQAHAIICHALSGNEYTTISHTNSGLLYDENIISQPIALNLNSSATISNRNMHWSISTGGTFANKYKSFNGALQLKVSL
jgi:hypothetical protein